MCVPKPFDAQAAISVKAVAHTPSNQEPCIQSTSSCPKIYIIIHRASELYQDGQERDGFGTSIVAEPYGCPLSICLYYPHRIITYCPEKYSYCTIFQRQLIKVVLYFETHYLPTKLTKVQAEVCSLYQCGISADGPQVEIHVHRQ